jgi:hypothetical protein
MSNHTTSSRPLRGFLIASWLVLAGPIFLVGVNFLVVLKTGNSLLGWVEGAGGAMPEWLVSNPWLYFLLSGDVVPGYMETPNLSGVLLMLLWLGLVLLCGAGLHGLTHRSEGDDRPPNSRFATLSRWAIYIGAGILTAGLAASSLEILNVWKKLALHPDPKQESGAPFWLWWVASAACTAAWYLVLKARVIHYGQARKWLKAFFGFMLLAAILASVSLGFHVARPEPTQGRYYGIPGFVVGRAHNVEYGTYYGMVSGTVVFLSSLFLTTCLLIASPKTASSGNLV